MKYLERTDYMNKLNSFKDKQLIKVITGIRRCGKSTLMNMFEKSLINTGTDEAHIIHINLEDYNNRELRNPANLHQYITEKLRKDEMTYIFLDEIQQCKNFPEVVDSLYIRPDTDIYLTGSNAVLLSGEIATLLSGRYVEIPMLPLSFKEFVFATHSSNLSTAYREYIENSSFPYALSMKGNPDAINAYIEGLYNTIVVKDICDRYTSSDTLVLKSIIHFIFDNIGNPLSKKKISDTLCSYGRKTDVKTVEKYINALTEAFVLYKADRYDIKGKQYLRTLGKYYVADVGMRYNILGSKNTDTGRMLENVIYLELLRRGYKVYTGKTRDLEVDFVAVNSKKTLYYQVAATVRDENTLKRELAPLLKINDSYQKFILTLDDDPDADYNGIIRTNALQWLMNT